MSRYSLRCTDSKTKFIYWTTEHTSIDYNYNSTMTVSSGKLPNAYNVPPALFHDEAL